MMKPNLPLLALLLLAGAVLPSCKSLPSATDRNYVSGDAIKAARHRDQSVAPRPYFFDSQAAKIEKNLGL
jgi:hypothetical protein